MWERLDLDERGGTPRTSSFEVTCAYARDSKHGVGWRAPSTTQMGMEHVLLCSYCV